MGRATLPEGEPRSILFRSLKKFLDQPEGECWVWEGTKLPGGYGMVTLPDRRHNYVHRVMYELFREPVPQHLQLDHLCKRPACCNPAHLEIVTCRENLRRGNGFVGQQLRRTHCPRGHALVAPNLINSKLPKRQCRECDSARKAQLRYKPGFIERRRAYDRKRYETLMADPERYARYRALRRERYHAK